MKYATENQILEVARKFAAVGSTNGKLYGIDFEGNRTVFAAKIYRDSLHVLAEAGSLKYNGDYTYSKL